MESGSSSSCRAWSLDTLEEPPSRVVDAGQKTPTPMSVFNDRECQFSVIAHRGCRFRVEHDGRDAQASIHLSAELSIDSAASSRRWRPRTVAKRPYRRPIIRLQRHSSRRIIPRQVVRGMIPSQTRRWVAPSCPAETAICAPVGVVTHQHLEGSRAGRGGAAAEGPEQATPEPVQMSTQRVRRDATNEDGARRGLDGSTSFSTASVRPSWRTKKNSSC